MRNSRSIDYIINNCLPPLRIIALAFLSLRSLTNISKSAVAHGYDDFDDVMKQSVEILRLTGQYP